MFIVFDLWPTLKALPKQYCPAIEPSLHLPKYTKKKTKTLKSKLAIISLQVRRKALLDTICMHVGTVL